jgi:hypothetical protein
MKSLSVGLAVIMLAIIIIAALRIFVIASEKDSLLVQLNEQKKALNFLQETLASELKNCHVAKADVEIAAAKQGWTVAWDNKLVTVGPFKLTRSENCVDSIKLISY